MMNRFSTYGTIVLGMMIIATTSVRARALMIAPAPVPDRVASSEAVLVGKVTKIEEKKVSLPVAPGSDEKQEFVVALLHIQNAIKGAKDVTDIKVGYPAPPEAPPAGGPIRPGIRRPQITLSPDQEVLIFLKNHHSGDFLVVQAYFDVVDKKSPEFEKSVEQAKKCVKLLEDPKKSLQSKDSADRLTTASMLLTQYRTWFGPEEAKEVPIDAEESKLILKAIQEGDWAAKPAPGPRGNWMTPQALFFRLGLTPADKWNQPQDFTKTAAAAQTWLKENADTYRIKRFVTKTEKKLK